MLDRTLGRDILDQEMRMCRATYGAILGSPGWLSWKGKDREWEGGLRQVLVGGPYRIDSVREKD